MDKNVLIQEFAIVIVAKSHNPSILNPDFLFHNKIVPKNWELVGSPISTEPLAHVKYVQGVSIVAQFEKLIFSEMVAGKSPGNFKVPNIAKKYTEVLPHVDYTAVGINIKGHAIASSSSEAESYATDKLIADGSWRDFRNSQLISVPKFIYILPDGKLTITVDNGVFPDGMGANQPVVIFGSNVHRDLKGDNSSQKLKSIAFIVDNYKEDISTFNSLVNDTLLA